MLGGSQKLVTQCSTTTRGNTNQYLKAELQYIYRGVAAMSNYNVKGQRALVTVLGSFTRMKLRGMGLDRLNYVHPGQYYYYEYLQVHLSLATFIKDYSLQFVNLAKFLLKIFTTNSQISIGTFCLWPIFLKIIHYNLSNFISTFWLWPLLHKIIHNNLSISIGLAIFTQNYSIQFLIYIL